jgi:hypothetical protein
MAIPEGGFESMKKRMRLGFQPGPKTAIVTGVGMLFVFVAFVMVVLASLMAFAAVVAAVTAYVKRDTWTLPAYRWGRDRSGRWRVTPWASKTDSGAAPEETPV